VIEVPPEGDPRAAAGGDAPRRDELGTFRALLDAAPDAMVIANGEGRIALANANAEKLFGYGPQELLGSSVQLLVPARFAQRHAAQRSDYSAAPHVRPMGSGLELNGRRKDGSEFPVDICLSGAHREYLGDILKSARHLLQASHLDVARARRGLPPGRPEGSGE